MSVTDFLKKDISFKRKPSPKAAQAKASTPEAEAPAAETKAPTAEKTPKRSRSLSLPKRERKPSRSSSSGFSGGKHKQIVGLKIGSSQLAAAVVVNNGQPKLVK